MIRTTNPALNDRVFRSVPNVADGEAMTIEGAVNKTFISVVLTIAAAAWGWSDPVTMQKMFWVFVIGTLLVALAISFVPKLAPFLTPVYAVAEGLFLGSISWFVAASFSGDPAAVYAGAIPPDTAIIFQAIGLTFGTLLAMLAVYRSGLIKVTDRFRMIVVAATGGIFLFYLLTMGLRFFGVEMPMLHSGGLLSIGISVVVVGVAALNLVLDFDTIEQLGKSGSAPKYMEWYAAFGLLVTLVWLYIEILHLLSKLQSRD